LKGIGNNGGSKVSYFTCSYNEITSLEFTPEEIYYFNCSSNKITSLRFAPKTNQSFTCNDNKGLTSLEYFPEIGEDCEVYISGNKLTSLEGLPEKIGWNFDCSENDLTDLKFSPEIIRGRFTCSENLLTSLEGSPTSVDTYVCKEQRSGVIFSIRDIQEVCDVRYKIITQ